jgi:hypothetical protein
MASSFPTGLDSFTNPNPDASLAVNTHTQRHVDLQNAIVAIETRIGVTGSAVAASLTHRTSATGEGAAIGALTAKTTPVDADLIGLSDSEAGGVLKKFSWANIKAALRAVFATLSGVAGGQTLTGGTAASETLTLRSTAHATKGKILFGSSSAFDEAANDWGFGTTSPSAKVHVVDTAEQLRLGYDAATYSQHDRIQTWRCDLQRHWWAVHFQGGINSTATLGSDLVTNGDVHQRSIGLDGFRFKLDVGPGLQRSAKHTSGSLRVISRRMSRLQAREHVPD